MASSMAVSENILALLAMNEAGQHTDKSWPEEQWLAVLISGNNVRSEGNRLEKS